MLKKRVAPIVIGLTLLMRAGPHIALATESADCPAAFKDEPIQTAAQQAMDSLLRDPPGDPSRPVAERVLPMLRMSILSLVGARHPDIPSSELNKISFEQLKSCIPALERFVESAKAKDEAASRLKQARLEADKQAAEEASQKAQRDRQARLEATRQLQKQIQEAARVEEERQRREWEKARQADQRREEALAELRMEEAREAQRLRDLQREEQRKREEELQRQAKAAVDEANKPVNLLGDSYLRYIFLKRCFDARLDYQVVFVGPHELENAREAVSAIESVLLKSDNGISKDWVWKQASERAGRAVPSLNACQNSLHGLIQRAAQLVPNFTFQKKDF